MPPWSEQIFAPQSLMKRVTVTLQTLTLQTLTLVEIRRNTSG